MPHKRYYTSISVPIFLLMKYCRTEDLTKGLCLIIYSADILWGESTGHLAKGSNAELWYLFAVRLNNLLNIQSTCRWLETPWRSDDVTTIIVIYILLTRLAVNIAVKKSISSRYNFSRAQWVTVCVAASVETWSPASQKQLCHHQC